MVNYVQDSLPAMPPASPTSTRTFIQLRRDNPNESNLTNLNVVHDLDRLYIMHSDWLAHLTRYSFATWFATYRLKGQASVLDVGSARLELLQFLYRNRGKIREYVGLDLRATQGWLDEPWLQSDSVPPVTLVRMDVVEDQVPEGVGRQWDLVTCFETLEHVPRDRAQRLVNNLFKWTKPGGYCLLSSPNAGASTSTADNHRDSSGVSREHTYEDKVGYVVNAGFILDETFGTFIRLDNLPPETKQGYEFGRAKAYLKGGWLNVLFAAAYPHMANNALFVLHRPA